MGRQGRGGRDGLFSEDATIGFALSPDSPAEEVRYRGKQQIWDLVKRGLKNNLSIDQARDHRLVAGEATCWLLVSANHLRTPAKGRAEAVVRGDRIEALSFRPLNEGATDGLRALASP